MDKEMLQDLGIAAQCGLCVATAWYVLMMRTRTRGSPRSIAGSVYAQNQSGLQLERIIQLFRQFCFSIGFIRHFVERTELQKRRMVCLQQLPVLLDVVILGLSAGLSFDASLDLYCSHYQGALADAFSAVMLQERLGIVSKREALLKLDQDMKLDALSRFISSVVQALECGSPLVHILAGQAEAIRDAQRSELEEQIEKVPVKMLIPMGTLIVPAMLISIVGPLIASAAP